jgi:hypothetical protein
MSKLQQLLDQHLERPFPTSVVKGTDIGGVDVVMIDADIYGWSLQRAKGVLTDDGADALRRAAQELAGALPLFPTDAQPYYQKLLEVAKEALDG